MRFKERERERENIDREMCLSCLGFVVLRIGLLCSFVEIGGAVEHFAMIGAVWADPEFPLHCSLV